MDRDAILTMEEALEKMRGMIGYVGDWVDIATFIPDGWRRDPKKRRSAAASTFAAALELVKAGKATIRQSDTFAPIHLKSRGPDEQR